MTYEEHWQEYLRLSDKAIELINEWRFAESEQVSKEAQRHYFIYKRIRNREWNRFHIQSEKISEKTREYLEQIKKEREERQCFTK